MRGSDLVGAYLVTRANKDYPVFIKTPKGIEVPPDMCVQAVGNLYGIMYALNVLSRYGNNPGPRHIEFLKHLLKYCKYSKLDRLKFHTHNGPTDIKTMTEVP